MKHLILGTGWGAWQPEPEDNPSISNLKYDPVLETTRTYRTLLDKMVSESEKFFKEIEK